MIHWGTFNQGRSGKEQFRKSLHVNTENQTLYYLSCLPKNTVLYKYIIVSLC